MQTIYTQGFTSYLVLVVVVLCLASVFFVAGYLHARHEMSQKQQRELDRKYRKDRKSNGKA